MSPPARLLLSFATSSLMTHHSTSARFSGKFCTAIREIHFQKTLEENVIHSQEPLINEIFSHSFCSPDKVIGQNVVYYNNIIFRSRIILLFSLSSNKVLNDQWISPSELKITTPIRILKDDYSGSRYLLFKYNVNRIQCL